MSDPETTFYGWSHRDKEQELALLIKKVNKTESVMNNKLAVAILAAGLGKRMKSPDKPKVMFEINGRPMIDYVVELAFKTGADVVVPIVGHHREQVIDFLNNKYKDKDIQYAIQAEQHGTGHAVMQTEDSLGNFDGEILILSGDVPLLKFETVQKLIEEHFSNNNTATLLTTVFKDSHGYGRIVRDTAGNFLKIVEEKDATDEEKQIKEINPAIYIVNGKALYNALKEITPENNQKEYYLTDIFHFIPKEKTGTVVTNDELEVTGVNSIEQLKEMETALNSRK
jgi:bifunctional UDP-N-acetylglucosamine pyrophosphorylase / glucosamine-1-phosphate N-acetyltransferase